MGSYKNYPFEFVAIQVVIFVGPRSERLVSLQNPSLDSRLPSGKAAGFRGNDKGNGGNDMVLGLAHRQGPVRGCYPTPPTPEHF